ncbi:MAG TPA: glycosyltransferase [Candidatus Limnocylindria bacterium]|nr:glycosyltransferase [Candidatus Limnocylindria bacterium]
MSQRAPADVLELVEQRAAARSAGDFGRADALRDRIHALGWEVQDGPTGSTVRPTLPDVSAAAGTGYVSPEALTSRLDEAATTRLSVVLVADDHLDDLERALRSLAAHPPAVGWELVLVANAPAASVDPVVAAGPPVEATVLETSERLGWGDAANLGLRRAMGEVIALLDTSLEATGDWATPLLAAFSDPGVGVAGGWGVRSGNARQFEEAPPGEVDAVEGYCFAVRREALREAGLFDHRYRWYRHADLDLSFAIRGAGWRAVRTAALPFTRHEHRGYAAFDEPELARQSKRNFYRFLRRWGDRRDLLLEADPPNRHQHDHDPDS